jgi:hypothetical protein
VTPVVTRHIFHEIYFDPGDPDGAIDTSGFLNRDNKNRLSTPHIALLVYLLVYVVLNFQWAPLGPIRKCPHLFVPHNSILDSSLLSSTTYVVGTRHALGFEAAFETGHCSLIFHVTRIQVPVANDSVGKKFLRCLLPQVLWAVCTSGRSFSVCCQLKPCIVVKSINSLHNLESLNHIKFSKNCYPVVSNLN